MEAAFLDDAGHGLGRRGDDYQFDRLADLGDGRIGLLALYLRALGVDGVERALKAAVQHVLDLGGDGLGGKAVGDRTRGIGTRAEPTDQGAADEHRLAGNGAGRSDLIAVDLEMATEEIGQAQGFDAVLAHDGMNHLAEKVEEDVVGAMQQVQPRVVIDPVIVPIDLAPPDPVAADLALHGLVAVVARGKGAQVEDPGQELHLVQPTGPVDLGQAQLVDDVAARDLADPVARFGTW